MSVPDQSPAFVDSNIWLYAFIEADTPDKSAAARRLLQSTQAIISAQVINEVCVNLLRYGIFSEEQIRELIKSFYEKYEVIEFAPHLLLQASTLRQKYSLSFWDSMIVAAGLVVGVETLYSEDMQDGLVIEDKLQIINPFREARG